MSINHAYNCSGIDRRDLVARMPPDRANTKGKICPQIGVTAIGNKCIRMRRRQGLIAWEKRPKSIKKINFMIERLPRWMQDSNTTRGAKPLTKSELERFDALTGQDPAEEFEDEVEVKIEHSESDDVQEQAFDDTQQQDSDDEEVLQLRPPSGGLVLPRRKYGRKAKTSVNLNKQVRRKPYPNLTRENLLRTNEPDNNIETVESSTISQKQAFHPYSAMGSYWEHPNHGQGYDGNAGPQFQVSPLRSGQKHAHAHMAESLGLGLPADEASETQESLSTQPTMNEESEKLAAEDLDQPRRGEQNKTPRLAPYQSLPPTTSAPTEKIQEHTVTPRLNTQKPQRAKATLPTPSPTKPSPSPPPPRDYTRMIPTNASERRAIAQALDSTLADYVRQLQQAGIPLGPRPTPDPSLSYHDQMLHIEVDFAFRWWTAHSMSEILPSLRKAREWSRGWNEWSLEDLRWESGGGEGEEEL